MNENRNIEHTYFERLLKEKSDEFVLYPSKRVWHGIYNNVHPGRKWPSISMSIVLLSILLIIGFLNNPVNNSTLIQNTAKAEATVAILQNPVTSTTADINPKRVSAVLPSSLEKITTPVQQQSVNEPFINSTVINNTTAKHNLNNRGNYSVNTSGAVIETIETSNQSLQPTNQPNANNIATLVGATQNPAENLNATSTATGLLAKVSAGSVSTEKNNTKQSNQLNESVWMAATNTTEKSSNAPQDANSTYSQKRAINQAIETGNLDYLASNADEVKTTVEKEENRQFISLVSSEENNQKFNPDVLKSLAFRNNNPLPTPNKLHLPNTGATAITAQNIVSDVEKSWIEHYALYHRAAPKKWKGKLEWQQYITPSVVYRSLKNNAADQLIAAQNYLVSRVDNRTLNNMVNQSPNIGLEAGLGLRYPLSKSLKVKAGLQLNLSRYTLHAFDNAHPIATSITLNDNNANQPPYQVYKTTTYSNLAGIQPVNLHNTSLQLAIPIGFDYKIWGNDRMKWYVSSTVQPSVVLLGRNYLLSTDQRNYIRDNDLMNRFNLHAGFETFLAFEKKGYTLQVGPQFRQQIFTTNTRLYTIEERIQQFGFKVGITRKR